MRENRNSLQTCNPVIYYSLGLLIFAAFLLLMVLIFVVAGGSRELSAEEALDSLRPILWSIPFALVWGVGIMVAVRHLKRARLSALLAILAFGLMLFVLLLQQIGQLMLSLTSVEDLGSDNRSWVFSVIGIVTNGTALVSEILIIAAIFTGRSHVTSE